MQDYKIHLGDYGERANDGNVDPEQARAIEQQFSIESRLRRRLAQEAERAAKKLTGCPFEEPGHWPAPPVAEPANDREYAIPSKLLLFCAKERYTVVDFIPTFGGALMYEHWIIGGCIVAFGVVANWATRKQIARYQ